MCGRVNREGVDAGASVDVSTRTNAVVAPTEPIDIVGHCDPDLVRRLTESHTANSAVEHSLNSGRRDSLSRCDHTRVSNVAFWSWLLYCERTGKNSDGGDQHSEVDATITAAIGKSTRLAVAPPLQPLALHRCRKHDVRFRRAGEHDPRSLFRWLGRQAGGGRRCEWDVRDE